MRTMTRSFAKVGAVIAISSIALVGCTSTDAPAPKNNSSSSTEKPRATKSPKSAEATADGAAALANEFLAAVIEEKPDPSNFKPPITLTEEQSEQLILDGKVDGVSDEDLQGLVDYLYENHPLGRFVYFDDEATTQQRLQAISALVLVQSFAATVSEDQAPKKIAAEDVVIDESGSEPTASFAASGTELAPTMIFGDGKWQIDGLALLESLGTATGDEAAPAEGEPVPAS